LNTSAYYFLPYFAVTTSTVTIKFIQGGTTRQKTFTPSNANSLLLFNISPVAINAEVAWDGGGTYFDITLQDNYTVQIGSETYVVNLICDGMFTNYQLHFLNKFGGFETMLFNKVKKRTYEVEKKEWQQLPYRVSSSGVVSVKTGIIMHSQKSNYASVFKEKLRINTDILSDAEYQWLSELVVSPFIYLEDAGIFYPIVFSSTNYDFKEWVVDGLSNLAVDIEFGSQYKAQFR